MGGSSFDAPPPFKYPALPNSGGTLTMGGQTIPTQAGAALKELMPWAFQNAKAQPYMGGSPGPQFGQLIQQIATQGAQGYPGVGSVVASNGSYLPNARGGTQPPPYSPVGAGVPPPIS